MIGMRYLEFVVGVVVAVVMRSTLLKSSRRCTRASANSSKKVADISSGFSLVFKLLICVHGAVSRCRAARWSMQPSGAKLDVIQGVASKEYLEALMQSECI